MTKGTMRKAFSYRSTIISELSIGNFDHKSTEKNAAIYLKNVAAFQKIGGNEQRDRTKIAPETIEIVMIMML